MNIVVLILGVLFIVSGQAILWYVTIPSITNIGETVGEAIDDSQAEEQKISGEDVGGAIISGILLWFTTGSMIALHIIGIFVIVFGVAD